MPNLSLDIALPRRLSGDRLGPYLAACSGDLRAAIRLYEWNIAVSGAVYESLHIVEVVLRNAIHDELTRWHDKRGLSDSWLTDPWNLLERRAQTDIQVARDRINRAGKDVTPAAIVAELGFGFWRYLLAKRYTHPFWSQALRNAFPNLPKQERHLVENPVARLHLLRNRIAHLEPIYQRDLREDSKAMAEVVGFVCPVTRRWLARLARLPNLLAQRDEIFQATQSALASR